MNTKIDAAPPIDAAVDAPADDAAIDARVDDAGPDAEPAAFVPGQEYTSAGARLTGPTFTLDVQIGHPIDQGPVQGPTHRLEPNTPIKP